MPTKALSSVSKGSKNQILPSAAPVVGDYKKNNQGSFYQIPSAEDTTPGANITTTQRVNMGVSGGLSAPLGPREMAGPLSADDMAKKTDILHKSTNEAIDKFQLDKPSLLPFIPNSSAARISEITNSPEFIDILRSSTAKMQESSGVNDELMKTINSMKPTGAHAKYAKSIREENTIDVASRRLMSANKNFYKTIEDQCPNYKDNQVCEDFAKMQNELLTIKLEDILLNNLQSRERISQQIRLNNEQRLSILRLKELLATRMLELSNLEDEINRLENNVNVNSRSNYYKLNVKNTNLDWQTYIMFIYYEIFLFYIIISNFFPDGHYKKIISVVLILLYLFFPLIMKYSTIIFQKIYVIISQLLGNYPRNVKTLLD